MLNVYLFQKEENFWVYHGIQVHVVQSCEGRDSKSSLVCHFLPLWTPGHACLQRRPCMLSVLTWVLHLAFPLYTPRFLSASLAFRFSSLLQTGHLEGLNSRTLRTDLLLMTSTYMTKLRSNINIRPRKIHTLISSKWEKDWVISCAIYLMPRKRLCVLKICGKQDIYIESGKWYLK